MADGYTAASKQQWFQPTGFKHALLEVAIDALKRSGNPTDKAALIDAIAKTNYDSIIGKVQWSKVPVKNACPTPLVGGQWVAKGDGKFDLVVCENKFAPEIPVGAPFKSL